MMKWISRVLNTIPFVGNLVSVPYYSGGVANRVTTALFLPLCVHDVLTGVVLVPSEVKLYTTRWIKYSKAFDVDARLGYLRKNTVVQLSTADNKKKVMKDFFVGSIYNGGKWTSLMMSQKNLVSAAKRYEEIKDKLNLELTWKQKFILFLMKFKRLSFEVYKK